MPPKGKETEKKAVVAQPAQKKKKPLKLRLHLFLRHF